MNKRLNTFFAQDQIRAELQEIIAGMIIKDASSIEVLKDNAKTIGGVLGAEDAFLEQHKEDHEEFFVDRTILDV